LIKETIFWVVQQLSCNKPSDKFKDFAFQTDFLQFIHIKQAFTAAAIPSCVEKAGKVFNVSIAYDSKYSALY